MKILVSLALALFPAFLFAQSTVSGVVLDSLTNEPLPSATVYVNGTTKGTVTDSDGRFILENVSFPSTIVFSYVGYRPHALDLDRNPGTLSIELAANSELPEVVVSGKDKKINKEDLEYFRKMFLGDDRWGKHATIKNENVLMTDNSFKTSYVVRKISRTSYSIPTVYSGRMVHFDINNPDHSYELYEKTFVDFMLIAEATHIYRLETRWVRNSGFPYAASKVYGHPFHSICF